MKTKRNQKWNIPEMNLVLHLIYEIKIKSKTVMSWSQRKKNEGIFCTFYFILKGNCFNICVLFQCITYLIHNFTYQKALLHTPLLLVFKIIESFKCILNVSPLMMSNQFFIAIWKCLKGQIKLIRRGFSILFSLSMLNSNIYILFNRCHFIWFTMKIFLIHTKINTSWMIEISKDFCKSKYQIFKFSTLLFYLPLYI